jgi:hypothetical protein
MLDFSTIEIIPESIFTYKILICLAVTICLVAVLTIINLFRDKTTALVTLTTMLFLVAGWNKINDERVMVVKIQINPETENIADIVDNRNICEEDGKYYYVTQMNNKKIVALKQMDSFNDLINTRFKEEFQIRNTDTKSKI